MPLGIKGLHLKVADFIGTGIYTGTAKTELANWHSGVVESLCACVHVYL